MSDDTRTGSTHRSADDSTQVPRAIIHKQILDRAEREPDATMQAIADDISGVTVTTVERVLEQYGDPSAESHAEPASTAADDGAATDGGATSDAGYVDATDVERSAADRRTIDGDADADDGGRGADADADGRDAGEDADTDADEDADADEDTAIDADAVPEPSSLTDKQRETLRAIAERPAATQSELADELGVSSPTISQRVNAIDRFDWSNRHAFVEAVFENDSSDDPSGTDRSTAASDDRPTESDDGRNGSEPADDDEVADRCEDGAETAADRRALAARVDDLARAVASLEREFEATQSRDRVRARDGDRVARRSTLEAEPSVFDDPELAHRIVHACVHSDRITEAEELRILREITSRGSARVAEADD